MGFGLFGVVGNDSICLVFINGMFGFFENLD